MTTSKPPIGTPLLLVGLTWSLVAIAAWATPGSLALEACDTPIDSFLTAIRCFRLDDIRLTTGVLAGLLITVGFIIRRVRAERDFTVRKLWWNLTGVLALVVTSHFASVAFTPPDVISQILFFLGLLPAAAVVYGLLAFGYAAMCRTRPSTTE